MKKKLFVVLILFSIITYGFSQSVAKRKANVTFVARTKMLTAYGIMEKFDYYEFFADGSWLHRYEIYTNNSFTYESYAHKGTYEGNPAKDGTVYITATHDWKDDMWVVHSITKLEEVDGKWGLYSYPKNEEFDITISNGKIDDSGFIRQ